MVQYPHLVSLHITERSAFLVVVDLVEATFFSLVRFRSLWPSFSRVLILFKVSFLFPYPYVVSLHITEISLSGHRRPCRGDFFLACAPSLPLAFFFVILYPTENDFSFSLPSLHITERSVFVVAVDLVEATSFALGRALYIDFSFSLLRSLFLFFQPPKLTIRISF